MWIFLALLTIPLIEIGLFIEVGGAIGVWPTIAATILTAVIGTVLMRAQGFAALQEIRRQIDAGQDPGPILAHGALLLVAGFALLTPGFFTDALGFLLLVPSVRAAAIRFLARRMSVTTMNMRAEMRGHTHRPGPGGGQTIEGSWEEAGTEDGPPPGTKPNGSGWTQRPGGRSD